MIGKAIYSILTADANITGIVSNRVYPERAPMDVTMPFIVYTISGLDPQTTKDAHFLDVYSFVIYAASNDYDQLDTLTGYLRTALKRYRGTIGGIKIDQINFKNLDSGFDNEANVNVIELTYELRKLE